MAFFPSCVEVWPCWAPTILQWLLLFTLVKAHATGAKPIPLRTRYPLDHLCSLLTCNCEYIAVAYLM